MSKRDRLVEKYGSGLIVANGYDDAILGVIWQDGEPVVVYDQAHILRILCSQGMAEDEAEEFFEFNVAGAYVGPRTPLYLEPIAGDPDDVRVFRGAHAFLSNFWSCPVEFNGVTYASAEHAYQAASMADPADARRVAAQPTPAAAKHEANSCKRRTDWAQVRVALMSAIVHAKFTQNPELARMLLNTGRAKLIETNNWNDRFWGVCDGVGENQLGQILMSVRQYLETR